MTDPSEALCSIQDSIRSAESAYDNYEVTFATPRRITGINIAIKRILNHTSLGREDRLGVLRILFNRSPETFPSSRCMTLAGAQALRDRLYGPDTKVDQDTPFLEDAVLAVRQAYIQATGQQEMFT